MLLFAATGWSQDVQRDSLPLPATLPAADSVDTLDEDDADDEPNVIGARPSPKQNPAEENLIGAPVYYDRNGNIVGAEKQHQGYKRPKHHYRNNVGLNFNSFFVETEALIGHNSAIGISFTYLPQRIGVYGKVFLSKGNEYYNLGAAARLSGVDSRWDWHLYGGIILNNGFATPSKINTTTDFSRHLHIGGEIGFRMASPSKRGEFCWTSVSMGLATVNGYSYLTVGLSLEIAAITALSLFLW